MEAKELFYKIPVQHRCNLCAGRSTARQEVAVRALHDACSAGPLHGGERIVGDFRCVGIAEDICILANTYIDSLVLCVPVQDWSSTL